ncbi:MAG: hypothetical protein IIT61_02900, partial [Bacteroidales bacterium]|nr:hypothetical protein [Bacteroidales bacterium]
RAATVQCLCFDLFLKFNSSKFNSLRFEWLRRLSLRCFWVSMPAAFIAALFLSFYAYGVSKF